MVVVADTGQLENRRAPTTTLEGWRSFVNADPSDLALLPAHIPHTWRRPPSMTEIPLGGGNVSSGVVRIGDTVRRPAGPWTPAVHALLGHLHTAGFHGAPRPLGLDEHGREVLTFIPGTVAWPDNFHLLHPDDALRRVALLIRDFHDAVIGFRPPPEARWQALIHAEGTGIIAHHDLAPWNLVISPTRWAFIDWDLAAPGSRLWDIAYALHGFVPLSANSGYQRGNPAHRMRLFADTYGLDQDQRQELIPMLARRTKAMHDFLAGQAASGTQPWTRLWQQGHGHAWQADTDYITKRKGTWRHALLELPANSDVNDDRTGHCHKPWTVTKWLTISETNAAITSHLPEPLQVTSRSWLRSAEPGH